MADEIRIGNAEREAATSELQRHLQDGRLDQDEYADRAARAASARTGSELDALFTDLPRAAAPPVPLSAPVPLQKPEPAATRGGDLAGRIWAVSGSIAVVVYLVLGFVFHAWAWSWIVFLIVPIVSTLVGGGDPWAGRQRNRDRRRNRS